MAEYLNITDLTNRLTDAGIKFVADRDRNGTVSTEESAAYLTSAIQYAGNIVDGYLSDQLTPAMARGQGNAWLRDRAVDLAAWRAAGHGGRPVPKSLIEAKELALSELQGVKDGDGRIPGFDYPAPVNARWGSKTPKMANLMGGLGLSNRQRRQRRGGC